MFTFSVHPSFTAAGVHLGVTEALFPDRSRWDFPAFDRLKERELAALRQQMAGYDRKAVFGEDPYNRYFKKYKKPIRSSSSWRAICSRAGRSPAVSPSMRSRF